MQELTFELAAPGPGKAQTQTRPHQVAIDPTGRIILSVDLGDDSIRVFEISQDGQIHEIQGLSLPKGSYPRHLSLVTVQDGLKLYILLQEINAILVYDVIYEKAAGLSFSKTDEAVLARSSNGDPIVHSAERYLKASHILASVSQDANCAACN